MNLHQEGGGGIQSKKLGLGSWQGGRESASKQGGVVKRKRVAPEHNIEKSKTKKAEEEREILRKKNRPHRARKITPEQARPSRGGRSSDTHRATATERNLTKTKV